MDRSAEAHPGTAQEVYRTSLAICTHIVLPGLKDPASLAIRSVAFFLDKNRDGSLESISTFLPSVTFIPLRSSSGVAYGLAFIVCPGKHPRNQVPAVLKRRVGHGGCV